MCCSGNASMIIGFGRYVNSAVRLSCRGTDVMFPLSESFRTSFHSKTTVIVSVPLPGGEWTIKLPDDGTLYHTAIARYKNELGLQR